MTNDESGILLDEAEQDSDLRLSYNDVISAHLWRTYLAKWDDDDGEKTKYVSCPVDVRRLRRGDNLTEQTVVSLISSMSR